MDKTNKGNSDKRKKVIILTGGGSAGHVMPNLVLLPDLLAGGWDVHYIGSRAGIEAALARREGVTYHAVETGKLRRYMSVKNLTDPFRVVAGVFQSFYLIAKLRPRVIFSKGGYVAVPVVLGGKLLGAPVVIHESDQTRGLANKICMPFSDKICLSFETTFNSLAEKIKKKAVYTGAPVRPELAAGIAEKGYALCGFTPGKPVLLVIGGSQGSESLNGIIRSALPELLQTWQVAHICGKGRADAAYGGMAGYAQFEFAGEELAHLYKISHSAVSRAGSNTIFELLYLKIPSLLIPLPLRASRGDQIVNAAEFERSGFCMRLDEEDAKSKEIFLGALEKLYAEHDKLICQMGGANAPDSKKLILNAIYEAARV